MVLGVGLAATAVAWRTLATLRSIDDAALQSQARLVADRLSTGADGRPVLRLPAELDATFRRTDERNVFLVYDAAGHPLLASDAQAVASITAVLPARQGFFRAAPSPGFRQGLVGVAIPAGPWRVAVAQAREQNEGLSRSLMRDFLLSALWLLLPIGAATVVMGVLTIRHGLRPLRNASTVAAQIEPGQAGIRLPSGELPGEVLPLVGAVNAALGRLEQALEAQRRFVGDAAHALRTPLAVLTARIDELADHPDAAELRGDAGRMARLVEQMLAMARLEEIPLDLSGEVDLHRVAVAVISELAPLAIAGGIVLSLHECDAAGPVTGNEPAVAVALRNLLDNALRHAPAGSAVEVEIAPRATMLVRDHGPGVPERERARIFARFHRSPTGRSGGAGLGLAIVARIAAAHGGAAWMEPRAGGGSVFVLRLSAATA